MDYSICVLCFAWGLMISSGTVLGLLDWGRMGKPDGTSLLDTSEVTWAHAVNSRDQLEKEMNGTVDFIEADVSLGLVKGNQFGTYIPIMAHPPNEVSDISLEDWLDVVINRNTGKGIKLDFKTLDVVEPSLILLQRRSRELNFTLWLNADILQGPINAPRMPVKDDMFMYLCQQFFPQAVLSIGWTTEWFPTFPPELWHYSWQHVRKMADIIRCFGYENRYPTVTFPVRGIFASRSIKELQWLLSVVPGSSLTIWTTPHDPLEVKDLLQIRKSFPKDKVYYDLPESLREAFSKVKNNVSYDVVLTEVNTGHWMTLTRGIGRDCSAYTYVNNDTIVFGQSLYTAVLSKKLLVLEDQRKLRVQGKIEFFRNYVPIENFQPSNAKISIVIVDVSLFSRNLTSALDLAGSDSDVLWSAVNSSHVYTFDEKPSNMCRMFRLDTSEDLSFQAWTVGYDEMREGKSFEEITAKGVQEVPMTKRLVLPKVSMFGLVSSGDGYAVLRDFKIEDRKDSFTISGSSMIKMSLTALGLVFLSIIMGWYYT